MPQLVRVVAAASAAAFFLNLSTKLNTDASSVPVATARLW